jgi:hypothetical protein
LKQLKTSVNKHFVEKKHQAWAKKAPSLPEKGTKLPELQFSKNKILPILKWKSHQVRLKKSLSRLKTHCLKINDLQKIK